MKSTTRKNSLLAGGFKCRGATTLLGMALAGLLLAGSQLATASVMIVDRGLPTANLNNAAGADRSNVSWGEEDLQYFDGDDFTVPSGSWRIDTIRMWFCGYGANNNTILTDDTFLGNQSFGNLSLYVGAVGGPLNRVSQASFATPGSDATSNPNVVATRVQYNGGVGSELELDYGNAGPAGSHLTIVQLEFKNLNLYFAGGSQVQFGMQTDNDYTLSHASNADLSGSPQDQADDLYRQFQVGINPATATFDMTVDSNQPGIWDKSSDINVQVFATRVATSKDQCMNGGWKTLIRANGTTFKNQGDAIQYVNTGK